MRQLPEADRHTKLALDLREQAHQIERPQPRFCQRHMPGDIVPARQRRNKPRQRIARSGDRLGFLHACRPIMRATRRYGFGCCFDGRGRGQRGSISQRTRHLFPDPPGHSRRKQRC